MKKLSTHIVTLYFLSLLFITITILLVTYNPTLSAILAFAAFYCFMGATLAPEEEKYKQIN